MEANFKSEEEIKLAIIDHFNNQSPKFCESLTKEFKKEDNPNMDPVMMSRYGKTKIHMLYNEILDKDSQLFTGIEDPEDLIELILFEYILSKD